MAQLKMKTVNGKTVITRKGIKMSFDTLHEALEYVFYQRFIALVKDEPIGCANVTRYPVLSLLPPTKRKVVKVFVLESEEVR